MVSINSCFDKLSYIYGFIYILIFLILDFSASLSNYLFDWITNRTNIDLTIRLFIRITLSAAIYNRVKRFRSDVRSRPLQSVRRAFFRRPTVVILHKGKTRPRKPLREILKTSGRDSPPRIFPIARWERAVFLSDNLRFVRQKRSLCEAGAAPKSRPIFKLYNGY